MAVETEVIKRKPAIRYALPNSDGDRVEYFTKGNLTRPGARGPWGEDEDNPLSPCFRPVEGRTEAAKARWWALHGKRSARPTHGEYDAKPV